MHCVSGLLIHRRRSIFPTTQSIAGTAISHERVLPGWMARYPFLVYKSGYLNSSPGYILSAFKGNTNTESGTGEPWSPGLEIAHNLQHRSSINIKNTTEAHGHSTGGRHLTGGSLHVLSLSGKTLKPPAILWNKIVKFDTLPAPRYDLQWKHWKLATSPENNGNRAVYIKKSTVES